MTGWTKVREHIWRDAHGEPVLLHRKFIIPKGEVVFPWRTWVHCGDGRSRWLKGISTPTPPLLYGLPEFAAASRKTGVWLAEGEADCDALRDHGVLAVTSGGVQSFSAAHAELFRGWRGRITLVRDRDRPGAVDAVLRYDRLRAVGIPAARLRIVRGRVKAKGADAREHLDAGYGLDQFIEERLSRIRKIAAKATTGDFDRAGYGSRDYVVVSTEELAGLRGWKPVRA